MLIYLIRHGETVWNAEKRYQGSQDIELSREGMARLQPADFTPERVYVTKMRRTRQTAELLFPGVPQVPVEGLEEMCFGVFEGRNYIEMAQDPQYRAWVDGDCMGTPPGGESREGFTERVCHAMSRLIDQAMERGEERLVIVAHGGTQMAALERFGRPERRYYQWLAGNGKGYLLSTEGWPSRLTLVSELDFTRRSEEA